VQGCGAFAFPLQGEAERPAIVLNTSGTKWLMTSRNIALSGLGMLIGENVCGRFTGECFTFA
jgi:hypothetical protein